MNTCRSVHSKGVRICTSIVQIEGLFGCFGLRKSGIGLRLEAEKKAAARLPHSKKVAILPESTVAKEHMESQENSCGKWSKMRPNGSWGGLNGFARRRGVRKKQSQNPHASRTEPCGTRSRSIKRCPPAGHRRVGTSLHLIA